MACTVGRPQHCDCHSQCVAAGAFAHHIYPFCFRRASGGGPALSDIPSHTDDSVTFYERRRSGRVVAVDRARALRHEFNPRQRHVPAAQCRGRCSERGACIASPGSRELEPRYCNCDSYYLGESCETHAAPMCFNRCAGRGECVDGFCSCEPPYYGPGCSLPAARSKPRAAASARPFLIHVYDLPPLVLRRRTYGSDPDPIFNTCFVYLEALLSDANRLAADPSDASLFIAPACATNMEGLVEYYAHAAAALGVAGPWWARFGGADHAFWTTADGGGCDLNAPSSAVRRSIIVAHYLKMNTSDTGCGAAGKDVAVPPRVPEIADAAFLRRGATPPSLRPLRFFFAGNVPDARDVDGRTDASLSDEAYSEGVRQLVWKHLRRVDGYRIVSRSRSYATDWSDSAVCLAPLGVGWGGRLAWSIAAGCVPLLASSEVSAWFDDMLPYDDFSIRGVPKSQLRRLPALLDAVGATRLDQMHSSLLRHRRLFLWEGGEAYAMTQAALCDRARRQMADGRGQRPKTLRCGDLRVRPRRTTPSVEEKT